MQSGIYVMYGPRIINGPHNADREELIGAMKSAQEHLAATEFKHTAPSEIWVYLYVHSPQAQPASVGYRTDCATATGMYDRW